MKINPELIDAIVLDNNGLVDKVEHNGQIDSALSIVIDGLNKLKCLRRFVCKGNNFSTRCLFSMRKLLERKAPN